MQIKFLNYNSIITLVSQRL